MCVCVYSKQQQWWWQLLYKGCYINAAVFIVVFKHGVSSGDRLCHVASVRKWSSCSCSHRDPHQLSIVGQYCTSNLRVRFRFCVRLCLYRQRDEMMMMSRDWMSCFWLIQMLRYMSRSIVRPHGVHGQVHQRPNSIVRGSAKWIQSSDLNYTIRLNLIILRAINTLQLVYVLANMYRYRSRAAQLFSIIIMKSGIERVRRITNQQMTLLMCECNEKVKYLLI